MPNYRSGSRGGYGHGLRQWPRRGRMLAAAMVAAAAAWRERISGYLIPRRLRPRRHLVRYAPLLLAPALAAVFVIPLLPDSSSPSRPAAPPLGGLVRPAARSPQHTTGRPVTLATGDAARLLPGPGGRSVVSVTPPRLSRNTAAGTFTGTFEIGGDVYAVPGDALAFFGSVLDPRLFDISYLQRAGYAGLKALPVTISWRHPAHSAIPGVASPDTGSRTTGSIRMATASRFGQALARSRRPGDGLLGQVNKISLAPLPAARAQQPPPGPVIPGTQPLQAAPAVPVRGTSVPAGTKLYTLTINALDTNGQPGFAAIAVQNLQSFQRYYSVNVIAPGQPLAVSVPAGPYGVEAIIFDLDQTLNLPENISFVPVPQINVSSDTSTTVDARQAKPINIAVPDAAAAPLIAGMNFSRASADHNGLQGGIFTFGQGAADFLPPVQMSAKPTAAPQTGSLGFADTWMLTPPNSALDGGDIPYTYSLDFQSADGVPADLSHTLMRGDLATVHDSFAASVDGDTGGYDVIPFHSWSTLSISLLYPLLNFFPLPTEQVDYFGGSTATAWEQAAGMVGPPDSQWASFAPLQTFGPIRTFSPGEELSATWGNTPSVPTPQYENMGIPLGATGNGFGFGKWTWSYVCAACRQGDVMSFIVPGSSDSDRTHSQNDLEAFGNGLLTSADGAPTDSVKFYQDGTLTQVGGTSQLVLPMLPGKASYTIDWTHTIPVSWTKLGTKVHSVWTFTSARPAAPDKLPSFELCSPDVAQACTFVPLVFATYDFGANLQGQLAPGTETFTLTGYHQVGANGPPVTTASVRVSFDDGATWSPASSLTSLGGGRFRVVVTPPAPSATSGFASFDVSLSDAAGDTLRQTIIRAYALTGPTASSTAATAAANSK